MNIEYYSREKLNFIEVRNDRDLKVIFCDLGASVYQIYFDNVLMTRNVKNYQDFYRGDCYYGKTVGRTSNRLKGYRFEIHDKIYDLEKNEGDNVLHGGLNGLSTKRFLPSVKTYEDYIEVKYKYLSPHLESGYPGNVVVEVIYYIHKDSNRLDIHYVSSSDVDTLFSLTNHSYFSLGEEDISKLELFIRGSNYLEVDEHLLPIEKREVTPYFDFKKYRKLDSGYDHYFYFDEVNPKVINASLRSDKYRLDIFTNYQGLQVYTSNQKTEYPLEGSDKEHDSVALEPSDSFLEYPVLKKDEKYVRDIIYFFLKR